MRTYTPEAAEVLAADVPKPRATKGVRGEGSKAGTAPREAKATKRKASDGLGPGLKEQKELLQRQNVQDLLANQYVEGNLVEVRGTEEGFLGSWYAARILEAKEARSSIRLRLCYLAFQEDDGSFWEDWVDHVHVRPLPPDRDDEFIQHVRKGAPLEIFIEEGWWEVEYAGRDGDNYVAAAKRYHIEHCVPISQLRPAWKWNEPQRTFTVHDKLPPPISKAEQTKPSTASTRK